MRRLTSLVRRFWVWLFTPYPRPVSPNPLAAYAADDDAAEVTP